MDLPIPAREGAMTAITVTMSPEEHSLRAAPEDEAA